MSIANVIAMEVGEIMGKDHLNHNLTKNPINYLALDF
jgi:hypothetical protein